MNTDHSARPLILIGGGGHCKSIMELARQCGRRVAGVLDVREKVGQYIGVAKIVGTDADIPAYAATHDFIITIGQIRSPRLRRSLVQRVEQAGGRFATLISPRASVSEFAKVLEGTVVLSGACVNYGAFVGAHCIINTLCAIEHDAVIDHFCHISTGAMVNGDCHVGHGTFVGSGAVLVHGCHIAPDTIIGAGAVVTGSIYVAGTYAGVPARNISRPADD